MAEDNYNLRAAKGQAYNLAVHQAIANGTANDTIYIYTQYIRFYELGQLIQGASIDELKEVLK